MFRPNTTCQLYKKSDTYNESGEPTFRRPVTAPCGIVKFSIKGEKSSVRADSSASRGKANETTADVIILFPTNVDVSSGDLCLVDGIYVHAIGVFPRRAVTGQLDHYEVAFVAHPGL